MKTEIQIINSALVEEVRALNKTLNNCLIKTLASSCINSQHIVGGLSGAECSEDLKLETNIKNLLSAFQSNYTESIQFQAENIKLRRQILLITEYLTKKKLIDDFSHSFNR